MVYKLARTLSMLHFFFIVRPNQNKGGLRYIADNQHKTLSDLDEMNLKEIFLGNPYCDTLHQCLFVQ